MLRHLPRATRIYLGLVALGLVTGIPFELLLAAPWGLLGMFIAAPLPAPHAQLGALMAHIGGVVLNAIIITRLASSRSRPLERNRTKLAFALIGMYALAMMGAVVVGFAFPGDGDGLSFIWVVMLAMPWAIVLAPLGLAGPLVGFGLNCLIIWRAVAGKRAPKPPPTPAWWEGSRKPSWPR
jgi:hypothetical protein